MKEKKSIFAMTAISEELGYTPGAIRINSDSPKHELLRKDLWNAQEELIAKLKKKYSK